jgi:3-deoxy-D-manno-octulosonic-acid transferase
VRPDLVVLAEGELWPNFLRACSRYGVPVAVVNGRLSPRSLRRYRALRWLARGLFGRLSLCAAQTAEYADAYRALGVDPECVHVTGSVKYDGVTTDRHNPRTEALGELLGVKFSDVVWVAGSTQDPEEEVAVGAYERLRAKHPNLRLILVPRQKDRFDEVADWLRRTGRPFVRRSSLTTPEVERDVIVLVDTIGELSAVWGLADVAFVGGSLDGRRGGQNMIEPAAYGAAVVFGPHVWNFRDTAARLVAAGAAVQVADAARLEQEMNLLLDSPGLRVFLGTAARAFVRQQQGATDKTVRLLRQLLPEPDARQAA